MRTTEELLRITVILVQNAPVAACPLPHSHFSLACLLEPWGNSTLTGN